MHLSSPCNPKINLRMSIVSSNVCTRGSRLYAFLIISINDGRIPTLFLLIVTTKWINIYQYVSHVYSQQEGTQFLPIEKFPIQQTCLDNQTQSNFCFLSWCCPIADIKLEEYSHTNE